MAQTYESSSSPLKESNDQVASLVSFEIEKQTQVIAVSTPVPGPNGLVSPKTPIFHLPVYKISMKFSDDKDRTFFCDLADLCDFMDKMRRFKGRH